MIPIIGLAALTFDPQGAVIVPWRDGTETESISRRVSRTATLDGGAAISNRGYSPADRTLTISLQGESLALIEQVRRLVRLHGQVTVSMRDGVLFGVPESYDESRQLLSVLVAGTA